MSGPEFRLQRRYTRTDTSGRSPQLTGLPDIEHNRLALFWRPLIDLTESEVAPMRLRFLGPISDWIAQPDPDRASWFTMLGPAGLRSQVIHHSALQGYAAREPTDLASPLRTLRWNRLLDAVERFEELDYPTRSLVVFQLLQLSYCEYALRLAGLPMPNGDPVYDRYAYEVARAYARYRLQATPALDVFERLATGAEDRLLALASCAQGIGHTVRNGNNIGLAARFERHANGILGLGVPDRWHGWLIRSRYHQAAALLRFAERQVPGMRRELELAQRFSDRLFTDPVVDADEWNWWVAQENQRILTELKIKAVSRARGPESATEVRALCQELDRLDPYCIRARLVAADGYLAIGDYQQAALRYTRAGELGTASGAVGWFRAAQLYDHLGEHGDALNAMARCLELDGSAFEALEYVERHSQNIDDLCGSR